MVKVEILEEESLLQLKRRVNDFTRSKIIDIIDIKFQVETVTLNKTMYYAMVIYRQKQING